MKKTTLLLAAAWMLLLLFVPEPARADVDYLREPFTIETTTTSTSYIRFYRSMVETSTATVKINLEYRMKTKTTGDWSDWGDWTTVAEKDVTSVTTMYSRSITLTAGTSYMIQFRGINDKFSTDDYATQYDTNTYQIFPQASGSTTWNLTMYGNIMSLLVGYDSDNEATAKTTLAAATVIPCEYCFHGLFMIYGSSYTKSNPYPDKTLSFYAPLIDATNLFFPATGLKNNCYKNLFSNMAGKTNGLQHGPTFLATSFTDENGTAVDNTFSSAFMQCNSLQSARFSFTSCPTGSNFTSFTVYTTPDNKTLYAPAGFNPTSCSIGTWGGGHTIWSYDPNAEPGGGEGGDEPEEEIVSAPASVDVYQAATTDRTEILYDYPATITGRDDLTYGLVDMGYGVIWADRNVGANSSTNIGSYFDWGGTTEGRATNSFTQANAAYATNQLTMSELDTEHDAAYKNMGNNWRMPSKSDFEELLRNTTNNASTRTFTSKLDNTKSITFPAGGYYYQNKYGNIVQDGSSYCFYWSRTYYGAQGSVYNPYYSSWILNNRYGSTNTFYVANHDGTNPSKGNYPTETYWGMPVRGLYIPSFTTCNLTIIVGRAKYTYVCESGQEITITVKPDVTSGYVFSKWDDGNTNATRTFTVSNDIVYTAQFSLNSEATAADVDKNVCANTTKILYALNTTTANKITYTPKDLGYGIAWADRNVGATSETEIGNYYKWGDIVANPTDAVNAQTWSYYLNEGETLPVSYDVATSTLGINWRYPTKTELEDLKDNTTITDNKFSNSSEDSNYIILPAGGNKVGSEMYDSGYQYYWSSTLQGWTSSGTAKIYNIYGLVRTNLSDNSYKVDYNDYNNSFTLKANWNMPVRAIYSPNIITHTLTIQIDDYNHRFICEEGQSITITAKSTTGGYIFDKWEDNNSTNATRVFVMDGDKGAKALFKDDPSAPKRTVSFVDYDGSELQTFELQVGRTPVYSGEEPEREGYEFIGWTPAIAPMGDEDVVYTATYKKISLFTITNTHATQAMTVNLKRVSSYTPQPTVYVRITDANGNITYNWTAQQITASNTNVNVAGSATIPAGGKMEMYGNNTGFCTTTSTNNRCIFVISGGTAKLSGNLLSLVACSDGKTVNNDFTLPNYCFYDLFDANTTIVSAEDLELPSTSVSQGCYEKMFSGCTNLVKAPKILPATTMPNRCYAYMFQNCSSLTKSPDIYGQTYANVQSSSGTGSMGSMFSSCTNLSHIRTYLTTAFSNTLYYTSYWVSNVQTTAGSFYCPRALNREQGGTYCIPSNWKVYSYNVTFVPVGGNWQDGTNNQMNFTWRTDVSDVNDFMTDQTERVVGYYREAQCTNEITDINAILTERPSDDNTTYIYAKMAPTTNYYDITISTNPASGYGTVSASSMNDVEEGTTISTSSNTLTIGETTITATKTADDAQYTYAFTGWTDNSGNALPATLTGDTTIVAHFSRTPNSYTLTWDVNGGNALTGTYTNGTIDWGTDIVKPANPTRTDYTFGGWDANNDGKADEVAKTMPTTSLTYKAIWIAELPNITLCENCDNDHYNTFKSDYDKKTVNVTYPRQFSANRWSTMCLPFSLDLATMIANKMYGRVYEFKYATGNANTNSGVNLYFSNAKKIEAGTCYIVNANDALAAKTSFVFRGVTIDLSKDNGVALTSVGAYNNLPGYLSEGTIELVGTLRNGTLKGSATGNKYMGLKNNKIYYPNTDTGSTIWAYRGIFRSSEILDKQSMQKMRIIVDGEDRGELIIDADGDVRAPSDAPSRKFIRDGVLYIEREGVVYDAQGKRVEGSF